MRYAFMAGAALAAVLAGGPAAAQPTRPLTEIPDSASDEVRAEITNLYTWRRADRLEAATLLGELHADAAPAVPFLIDIIGDGPEVVTALARIGKPAVPALVAALNGDAGPKTAIFQALSRIKDPRATDAIIAFVSKGPPGALGPAPGGEAPAPPEGAATPPETPGAAARPKPPAGPDRSETAAEAARALGHTGDPKAVEPLVRSLKSGNNRLAETALMALGKLGRKEAVDAILPFLKDEYWVLRWRALDALGAIGDPKAVPEIVKVLDGDASARVRYRAALALGRIKHASAVDGLVKALAEDEEVTVRETAAEALGLVGDPKGVLPLIKALDDADPVVRFRTAKALGMLKDRRAVGTLIGRLGDEQLYVQDAAEKALGAVTGEDYGRDAGKWRRWLERHPPQEQK